MSKELNRLVHGHFQHIIDTRTVIFDIEHILFEALAVAGFAFEGDIGHELHLDRDPAFSFTFFTSPAFLIKGEIGSRIAHLLSQRLLTVKFTDLIIGPDIGHRVGTGTLSDGVLVDKLDTFDHVHIAFQAGTVNHQAGSLVQIMLDTFVENITHERTFTRTADACYDCHHIQGELHIDPFQIVFTGTFHLDIIIPGTAIKGHFYLVLSRQIPDGIAVATGFQIVHITLIDHFPTQATGLRTDVDNVIGRTDNLFVMLHHNNRIT